MFGFLVDHIVADENLQAFEDDVDEVVVVVFVEAALDIKAEVGLLWKILLLNFVLNADS